MGQLHGNGSLGIRWSTQGVSVSGLNGAIQKISNESTGEEWTGKNQAGETILWYGWDFKDVLDVSVLVTGASATVSASAAKPSFGDMLTVTDTLNNITGSFICQSSKLGLTNTEGATIDVKATQFRLITS